MSYVRQYLANRTCGDVFEKQKTGRAIIIFLLRAFLVLSVFVVTIKPKLAFAAPTQKVARPSDKHFHVQWSAPKFIRFVDPHHARFVLEGKTDPEVKINFQPNATSINSRMQTSALSLKEMSPSQKQIWADANGHFNVYLTLPFKYVEVPFQATKNGRSRNYMLSMAISKARCLQIAKARQRLKNSSKWKFGLEARSVNYSQTNKNNIYEKMVAANVSYQHFFSRRWSVDASAFMDVVGDVPFSTNQNEMSARFWGFSSDLIYLMPIKPHKWSIGVAGGLYYMTMLHSGANFGINNLWGPELYPIVRYNINNKNSLVFNLRYSPSGTQVSTSLLSHEASIGVSWIKQYDYKRSITFNLEFLQDEFVQDAVTAKANAINFGVSYGVP